MRPECLFAYYSSVGTLKGVGPRLLPIMTDHIGPSLRDLVFNVPVDMIHRPRLSLAKAQIGAINTIEVSIEAYDQSGPKGMTRLHCRSDDLPLVLVYFHDMRSLKSQHPVGCQRLVSGKLELFNNRHQMSHPHYLVPLERADEIPVFEPVYAGREGLGTRSIARHIKQALLSLSELDEWIDNSIKNNRPWPSFYQSLHQLHTPIAIDHLDLEQPFRQRLAYDEALAHQIALKTRRFTRLKQTAKRIEPSDLAQQAQSGLGFELTQAQKRVLAEVRSDLTSGMRMNRLIQGDVGSGKTIIAILSMIDAACAGFQAVLMAPTEILAQQHYKTAIALLAPFDLKAVILTGKDKGRQRADKRAMVQSGEVNLVFGTHAVFQDSVEFKSLELCVIDEQHRFGVTQRSRLFGKGDNCHLLSLSATPIPRTLALTQYGESDLSLMDEKPKGRQPIQTAILPRARLDQVYQRLAKAIEDGAQAYWICPMVEESEDIDSDFIAVTTRYEALKSYLKAPIGLVHGRMSAQEKEDVVLDFSAGRTRLLCATTVIEVGIDVPQASIIIIEQAEKFGLAQLHQLRGRVGRGQEKSACILLYDAPLSEEGRKRLEILRETEDGFLIAETDWKMRGQGDILGARQSGFPAYRFVDPIAHASLIETAAKDAQWIVEHKDQLSEARKKAVNILNHLFDWRVDPTVRID